MTFAYFHIELGFDGLCTLEGFLLWVRSLVRIQPLPDSRVRFLWVTTSPVNQCLVGLTTRLEGKIKAPAGRPAVSETPLSYIKRTLIPLTYARYLTWLQRRKQSMGLKGWELIRQADWWDGPPNERAARMTRRRLRLAMDWRRVHNIVSEANK